MLLKLSSGLTLVCASVALQSLSISLVSAEVFVQSSVSVTESGRANVNCTVTNESFIGWFDTKGQPISTLPSKRLHVSTQGSTRYLVITRANRTDKGTYQCRGSSQEKDVDINVEYAPELDKSQSSRTPIYSLLNSDDILEIKCVFTGNPAPNVNISKEGRYVKGFVTHGKNSVVHRFYTKRSEDFGFYFCKARNRVGEAKYAVEIYKAGPPESPSDVLTNINCDRINVSWKTPRNNRGGEVTNYKIDLEHNGRTTKSEILTASARSRSIGSLAKSTDYKIKLYAKNNMGWGQPVTTQFKTDNMCSRANLVSSSIILHLTMFTACLIRIVC